MRLLALHSLVLFVLVALSCTKRVPPPAVPQAPSLTVAGPDADAPSAEAAEGPLRALF